MKGFPQKGPKDWSPDPIKQILAGLDALTVDSAKGNAETHEFLSVADVLPDGTFMAYHVTDEPEKIARVLREGRDLTLHNPSDYECNGLYVSRSAERWKRRSNKRWEFLEDFSQPQKAKLAALIIADLREKKKTRYITEREYDQAESAAWDWRNESPHTAPDSIRFIAGQPWNVDIVGMARTHKLANPFMPYAVEVVFRGRYIDFTSEAQYYLIELAQHYFKRGELENISKQDLCATLRHYGWDGLFEPIRGGDPGQVLIWNVDKIISFGAPEESARLSGRAGPVGSEGATVHTGRRFETSLSQSGQSAIVREAASGSRIFGPMGVEGVRELREMAERLRTGLEPEEGRFKADLSKELPEIVDKEIYRRTRTISTEDLTELEFLLDDLIGRMERS